MKHTIRSRAAGIAASIEERIAAGVLVPGQRLPTVRALAASMRVSPVTVAAAYRHLHNRGLLIAEGRRGTRVRPFGGSAVGGASARANHGLVDLASGNPDPELLPPLEPAFRSATASARTYGDEAVLHALATFAAGEFTADGIASAALTVTSGALDAIQRLLAGHLRPGDRVGVEDPSFPALRDLLAANAYEIHPLAIDAEGPRPEAVEEAMRRSVRALVVTTRAQNPTGAAVSARRAADLSRVVQGRDLLLVENDPAAPIAGTPSCTLSGAVDRWAVIRSVSKSLGPDLRVALVAGDALSIARVARSVALGPRWVSHLLQQATLALWSDPANGRRLARAADVYAGRRTALVEALAACGITVAASSGFNVWIPVREETAAVQALAARGWAVAAGERFRIRSPPGIRVTTSVLDAGQARRFAADCEAAFRPSPSDAA